MQRYLIILTSAALILIFKTSVFAAEIPSKFDFPNASDGRDVLSGDLHTQFPRLQHLLPPPIQRAMGLAKRLSDIIHQQNLIYFYEINP